MARQFFTLIPSDTKIDFVKISKVPFLISIVMVLGSFFLLFTRGLNYGVDFAGGTEVHARFQSKPSADVVRDALKPAGLADAVVQEFGEKGHGEFLIRVKSDRVDLTPFTGILEGAMRTLDQDNRKFEKLEMKEDRAFIKFSGPLEPLEIQKAIDALSKDELAIAGIGAYGKASNHEYRVQFEGMAARIWKAFDDHFGSHKYERLQADYVGPKVGAELRMQAVGAVLIALIFILIYVWFRFDFEFAPGAVAALIHDAVLILGAFSLLQLQFDLSIVAAVLTIVGYSINDTIVIFDRIRENIRKSKSAKMEDLINQSVNETLSRSILTSGTALFASLSLVFLGGPITFNFALAFTIGIFAGTYSTLFVANPITILFHNYLQKRKGA